MINYILIGLVVVLVALAVRYIVKSFKSGKKCIGCPDSCSCGDGGCGCGKK